MVCKEGNFWMNVKLLVHCVSQHAGSLPRRFDTKWDSWALWLKFFSTSPRCKVKVRRFFLFFYTKKGCNLLDVIVCLQWFSCNWELSFSYTNMVRWNRLTCLWSKMSTFQTGFLQCKSSAILMLTNMFNTTCESFQMRYCMKLYFKRLLIYHKSNLKLPKKSVFIK